MKAPGTAPSVRLAAGGPAGRRNVRSTLRVRSPRKKSPLSNRPLVTGSAGAALCLLGFVVVAAVALVTGAVSPGGRDKEKSPPAATVVPSPGFDRLAAPEETERKAKRKRARKDRGDLVVTKLGPSQAVVATSAETQTETPSLPPAPATRPAKTPVAKAPKKPAAGAVAGTIAKGTPATAVATLPAGTPAPDASNGLLRLSVRSVGLEPDAYGDPELLVKLAIGGAKPSDGLPDKVTLHLKPKVPGSGPDPDPTLALRAQVDTVAIEPSQRTDATMRLRVRMTIAPAEAAEAKDPVVQDAGPGDGTSNVLAVTVPMSSFTPGDETPGEEPSEPGPGAPTAPGGPSEPHTPEQPVPSEPVPAPTPTPAPSEPAPAPGPDMPAPSEPAPAPNPEPQPEPQPGPAPTPAPSPAPEPTPAPPPAPGPAEPVAPTTQILIDLRAVNPTGESTTVPVTPAPTDGQPATTVVPVKVVLQNGVLGGDGGYAEEPPVVPQDSGTPADGGTAVDSGTPADPAAPADPAPTGGEEAHVPPSPAIEVSVEGITSDGQPAPDGSS
jgi:hypothetical protein